MYFDDRRDAGRQLAERLQAYKGSEPLILALPRGGVEVGYEVAKAIGGELDVWIVRKLGVPGHEEFGMGAISEGGGVYLNRNTIAYLGITERQISQIAELEGNEIERRIRVYRGQRPAPTVTNRTVILVDDGIATGGTVRAALQGIRQQRPKHLVLAVPVAPPDTVEELERLVDELIVLDAPEGFMAVGQFYRSFQQTGDDEVIRLLQAARREQAPSAGPPSTSVARDREVRIPAGRAMLSGSLRIPAGARGMVLFAHGSGSSRFSPRNRYVADVLHRSGLATLLIDLLTEQEESEDAITGHLRFDIPFLASRLVDVAGWLGGEPTTSRLPLGLFGSSTGAGAALVAAGLWPDRISAVVSRGGRPDLAGRFLAEVRAPTLLIVGGADTVVLELNREAMEALECHKRLEIVPGATHLFEEPGTLEQVAQLAARWFLEHLAGAGVEARP